MNYNKWKNISIYKEITPTNSEFNLSHLEPEHQKIILNFIKILKENHNWNFNIFLDSLKTLKIKQMRKKDYLLNAKAYYNGTTNTIYYKNIESITHELLHVSTYRKKEKTTFCGFEQHKKNLILNKSIGTGINEYFTMLMDNILFGVNYEDFNEIFIARNVNILTDSKMISLYNSLNLNELIKILNNYSSLKETIEFLDKLDYIYYHLCTYNFRKNKECVRFFYDSIMFTIRSYIYKLLIDYKNKTITSTEANLLLEKMILSTPNEFKTNIDIFTFNELEEIKKHVPDIKHINNSDIKRFKLQYLN